MPEEATVETPTTTSSDPGVQTPPSSPPPSPSVDEGKIVSKVVEEVGKSVSAQIKNTLRQMVGDDDSAKKQPHPDHTYFMQDPEGYRAALVEEAANRLRRESAQEKQLEKEFNEAATPIFAECPDLKKYPYEIQGDMAQLYQQNSNLTNKELVKKALEKTRERLGLKSLTEEERTRAEVDAVLVGTGSVPSGRSSFDDSKSTLDFIQARKSKANEARKR